MLTVGTEADEVGTWLDDGAAALRVGGPVFDDGAAFGAAAAALVFQLGALGDVVGARGRREGYGGEEEGCSQERGERKRLHFEMNRADHDGE